MIAMSSFLMNSGTSYGVPVDPKFPPSEEYSQSSYIPAMAAATANDVSYYSNVPHHQVHQHHHHHGGYHHVGYHHQVHQQTVQQPINGHHHHQGAYYGQPAGYGGGGGYGGGTPCGMNPTGGQQAVPMTGHVAPASLASQQQQQQHLGQLHQDGSPVGLIRSPASSPTPSLTSMAPFSQHDTMQQHGHLQSMQHQGLMQQHDQLAHLGSMVAQQPQVPPSSQQQQLQVPTSQTQINSSAGLQLCQPPTPGSPMESDLDDGSDMSDDSHNPVIYPWMKKIHVAGARKFCNNQTHQVSCPSSRPLQCWACCFVCS